MTEPAAHAPIASEGQDVEVDVSELDDPETPATSDPAEMTDDGELGGVAGQGGAG